MSLSKTFHYILVNTFRSRESIKITISKIINSIAGECSVLFHNPRCADLKFHIANIAKFLFPLAYTASVVCKTVRSYAKRSKTYLVSCSEHSSLVSAEFSEHSRVLFFLAQSDSCFAVLRSIQHLQNFRIQATRYHSHECYG